ncbi:MAG: glucokinase [Candidatus Acidiferrales bacterium]
MILAGDLGGTKANLGLFDVKAGKLARIAHKRYATAEFGGLEAVVTDFLGEMGGKVTAASFGIAGPVVQNRVHATNFPWIVDGAAVAQHLGISRVRLLNDLEAAAFGTTAMEPADLEMIHEGVPVPESNRVVIAAGTGLGEAILFWDGTRHLPMATEGGHADFAPHTEQQADLWKFLKDREEYVSNEIILSGGGFKRVHEFLNISIRHDFDEHGVDPAPGITQRGLSGECPVCAATLDLWVDIYGSEAGNLAVRSLARGGIFVTGGIAVKILPKMTNGRFIAAVRDKEKMGDFLAPIPVVVVLNEECPLIGAAFVAWKGL